MAPAAVSILSHDVGGPSRHTNARSRSDIEDPVRPLRYQRGKVQLVAGEFDGDVVVELQAIELFLQRRLVSAHQITSHAFRLRVAHIVIGQNVCCDQVSDNLRHVKRGG